MKGRSTFTKHEVEDIERLIIQKLSSTTNEQKGVRNKIRAKGFYASDFGLSGGYTVADFRRVVRVLGNTEPEAKVTSSTVGVSAADRVGSWQVNPSLRLDHSKDIIPQLKDLGFNGFVSIKDIRVDYGRVPDKKGVYLILSRGTSNRFLDAGTGGFFKMKNPNVLVTTLRNNWVSGTSVLYIGKAGSMNNVRTLRSRLKEYFRFGQGLAVGHWGGRYIWQLAEAEHLLVCWKELPSVDPSIVESELIRDFKNAFGRRPFANLRD